MKRNSMRHIAICSILVDDGDTGRQTITWNRGDKMLYNDDTGLPFDWEKFDTLEEAVEECDRRWGWGDAAGIYEIKWADGMHDDSTTEKHPAETEINITLTEREIELIMYAIEGYAARAKMQAAMGQRDREKTKDLTDRLCEVNSKFYQIILAEHEKEAV